MGLCNTFYLQKQKYLGGPRFIKIYSLKLTVSIPGCTHNWSNTLVQLHAPSSLATLPNCLRSQSFDIVEEEEVKNGRIKEREMWRTLSIRMDLKRYIITSRLSKYNMLMTFKCG